MTVNLKLLAAQIVGMFVVFALALFLAADTRLACGLGLPFVVLHFHDYSEPMVAQPQPGIADGAHDRNRQTRPKDLG